MANDTPNLPTPEQPTITLSRISEILDRHQVNHVTCDTLPETSFKFERTSIATGFENVMILIDIDPLADVRVQGSWRGTPSADSVVKALAAANEYNLNTVTPLMAVTFDPDNQIIMQLRRSYPVTEGASDEQLEAFITSSLGALQHAADWLDHQFPEAVTWSTAHE